PDVKLQVAIASRKIEKLDPLPILMGVLRTCGEDKLIPAIVWQNLEPLIGQRSDSFLRLLHEKGDWSAPNVLRLMPRALDRLLAHGDDLSQAAELVRLLMLGPDSSMEAAGKCLVLLAEKIQTGEIRDKRLYNLNNSSAFRQVLF